MPEPDPHLPDRRAPIRVLIVEDDADHAFLVARLLEQDRAIDARIDRAGTIADALARLAATSYDAVILDLSLPDVGEGSTLTPIADAAPDAAVVVLTSVDDDDVAMGLVRGGAQDFLVKSEMNGELLGRSVRYAVGRKKTEIELRHTAERLRRTNEELTRFAHTVAHEVKTPLGVIATGLGLATSGGEGGENASLLAAAENAARDLARYVDELLRFAVDDDSVGSTPIDTESLFGEVLNVLRPVAEESGATIDRGDLPSVSGPPEAVRHLFVNLVANALKHGEARAIRVRVGGRRVGDRVEFAVEDSGRGVDPDDRERIFRMFDRGKKRRSRKPGNGIGLAFCQRVVTRLGGGIAVDESAELGGAAFRFDLPAANGAHQ